MSDARRQSNDNLDTRFEALEEKPFAEIVNDVASITIPANVETAFSWTSITRQRGNIFSVSGPNIGIAETGWYKATFQARFQGDVWTKFYVVRQSDNAIVGESVIQGNARDGNFVELIFQVTATGNYQFTTHMSTPGGSVTASAFAGSPRGVINRLAMLNVEKL